MGISRIFFTSVKLGGGRCKTMCKNQFGHRHVWTTTTYTHEIQQSQFPLNRFPRFRITCHSWHSSYFILHIYSTISLTNFLAMSSLKGRKLRDWWCFHRFEKYTHPKDHWTLQWKVFYLIKKGFGPQNNQFWGFTILSGQTQSGAKSGKHRGWHSDFEDIKSVLLWLGSFCRNHSS